MFLAAALLATCVMSPTTNFPAIKDPWRVKSLSYMATYSRTEVPGGIYVELPGGGSVFWLTPTMPVKVIITRPAPSSGDSPNVPSNCKLS